ncbi:NAD-dependent deacetylase (plasmid) [Mesomycoplasma conjunctivae]|nr:NAD-dependent deacetylase [Mesomycoplasma conjunctivae]
MMQLKPFSNSDLLIIAGTSLSVYPAASYIHFYQGKRIVILNKDTSRLWK